MKKSILYFVSAFLVVACVNPQKDAQQFLDDYNKQYQERLTASNEAAWKTNTEIREGDTVNAYNSRIADEALSAFTGSADNINAAKKFLEEKDKLTPLQLRQLEVILYQAGSDPQTVAPLVKE